MELAHSFRKAIEAVGLENINEKRFWNIVQDFHPLVNTYSFLWSIMVQHGVINDFLKLADSDENINAFITKTSYHTGFELEKLRFILLALREGVLCSFYGIQPLKNTLIELCSIYKENKLRWLNRIEELKDGIIIARKNKLYGVLSTSKEILPFKYRGATNFSCGLACFNDGTNIGFINIRGNFEIDLNSLGEECRISSVGPFSNGIAKIYGINGKIGYFSITEEITECIYDEIYDDAVSTDSHRTIHRISKDKLIGLMDNKCNIIAEPQYTSIIRIDTNNNFFLAKNDKQEWLVLRSGETISSHLTNPSLNHPGIIQDIRIYGNQVKYEFYSYNLKKLTSNNIDNVISSSRMPVLIHAKCGIYYFIGEEGVVFDKTGYEKAFPFVSNFTWVKVGNRWRRINKNGDVIYEMSDGDILTKEICCRVLRRNSLSSLIEVFNCEKETVECAIPNSNTTVVEESIGRISALNIYNFTVNEKHFIWSDGILLGNNKSIIRCRLSKRKIFICPIDAITYKLFCNGRDYGVFMKQNSEDRFLTMLPLKNGNEIIYYKTSDGRMYLFNVSKNLYSDYFTSIEMYSVMNRLAKAIIAKNSGKKSILLDSDFNVLSEWDKIEITSSLDYFKIRNCFDEYGLISHTGKIVIKPEYESLNYSTFDSIKS